MNFDRTKINSLLSLSDTELSHFLTELARGSGYADASFTVSPSDASRIRGILAVASNEEIERLLKQFGGMKNG